MEELSINSQWQSFVRNRAQQAKQGIVVELDGGVTVCWTQSGLPNMNGFFLSTPIADELDLRQRLEDIKLYVKKMQPTFPWVLFIQSEWLSPGVRERLREICLACDFVHSSDIKCMQTTTLLPSVRPLPDVEIKFATCQQDVYDIALLNVQAYNMDPSLAENMMEHSVIVADFDKQLCCMILVNGNPVATATTLLQDKCLYVAFVATSTQHRKQGYAEVALRASIERALEMWPDTKYGLVLHATELGRSVYERIGFKTISNVEAYVYKPSAFR